MWVRERWIFGHFGASKRTFVIGFVCLILSVWSSVCGAKDESDNRSREAREANYALDGGYYPGETAAMLDEARRHLAFFGYRVATENDSGTRRARALLRRAIEDVEKRRGIEQTGVASEQLVAFLRAARGHREFPCSEIYAAKSVENEASTREPYKFLIWGEYPARYMAQMLTRLVSCYPDIVEHRALRLNAGESSYGAFFRPGAVPVAKDARARELIEALADTAWGLNVDRIIVPSAEIAIVTNQSYRIYLSRASAGEDGIPISAAKPTESDLRVQCFALGYSSDCIAMDDLEGGQDAGDAFVQSYSIPIDHYEIEMRLMLPPEVGDIIAEDISQYVLGENWQNNSGSLRQPTFINEARSAGRRLQSEDDVENGVEDAISENEAQAAAKAEQRRRASLQKAEETHERMQDEVGWPASFRGSDFHAPNSEQDAQIVIVDTIDLDLCIESGRERKGAAKAMAEHVFGEIAPCRKDKNKGPAEVEWKHPYFASRKSDDMTFIGNTEPKKVAQEDPGHGLFAMGLIYGAKVSGKWGGLGGVPARQTPHTLWMTAADRFIRNHGDVIEDSVQAATLSTKNPINTMGKAEVFVIIGDANICDMQVDGGAWKTVREEIGTLSDVDLAASPTIFVIAAPYGCLPDDERKSHNIFCTDRREDIPTVCAVRHKAHATGIRELDDRFREIDASSHTILVASTERDARRALNEQLRPRKFKGAESREPGPEKYLAAPGCDLVSGDIHLFEKADPEIGVRRRDCGSSYAAPVVGALISRLKNKEGLNRAVDFKSQLIATSNPPLEEDRNDYFGVTNWNRALFTDPSKITAWFDHQEHPVPWKEDTAASSPWVKLCKCIKRGRADDSGSSLFNAENKCNEKGDLLKCEGSELNAFPGHFSKEAKAYAPKRDVVAIRRAKLGGTPPVFDIYSFDKFDEARESPRMIEVQGFPVFSSRTDLDCKSDSLIESKKRNCLELCDDGVCIALGPSQFTHLIFKNRGFRERQNPDLSLGGKTILERVIERADATTTR